MSAQLTFTSPKPKNRNTRAKLENTLKVKIKKTPEQCHPFKSLLGVEQKKVQYITVKLKCS